MKNTLALLKRHRRGITLCLLFRISETLCAAWAPVLLMQLLDEGRASFSAACILRRGLALIALITLQAVCAFASRCCAGKTGSAMAAGKRMPKPVRRRIQLLLRAPLPAAGVMAAARAVNASCAAALAAVLGPIFCAAICMNPGRFRALTVPAAAAGFAVLMHLAARANLFPGELAALSACFCIALYEARQFSCSLHAPAPNPVRRPSPAQERKQSA